MNRHAMLHVVDSAFCFPISEKEIVIRLRTANNDIKKAELIYESKYNFGMFQQRAKMTKKCTTELYDFFEIKLELSDTRLAYVFNVFDGDKYYYFSENGITEEYDFKYGFYNFFQKSLARLSPHGKTNAYVRLKIAPVDQRSRVCQKNIVFLVIGIAAPQGIFGIWLIGNHTGGIQCQGGGV